MTLATRTIDSTRSGTVIRSCRWIWLTSTPRASSIDGDCSMPGVYDGRLSSASGHLSCRPLIGYWTWACSPSWWNWARLSGAKCHPHPNSGLSARTSPLGRDRAGSIQIEQIPLPDASTDVIISARVRRRAPLGNHPRHQSVTGEPTTVRAMHPGDWPAVCEILRKTMGRFRYAADVTPRLLPN